MASTKKADSLLVNLGENITNIVVTGGPCSGKTTGLAQLSIRLTDRGYKVLVSPESATKLILAGVNPRDKELGSTGFQELILLDTLAQEQLIQAMAMRYRDAGRKVVILYDRGTMDGEAYCGPEAFASILGKLGYTHRQLCDERYHAAIHLRTAALGAEKYYTLDNNAARTETLEEARVLDEKTLNAWQRHQHPRVIDNSTNFEGKLHRLVAEVCAVLGDPVPLEQEEKFLIDPLDPKNIPVKWYKTRIVQDYLATPDPREERRLRARSDEGGTTYYYTHKEFVKPGIRVERESIISEREYRSLYTLRDRSMRTIEKERFCFFWEGQFFEVDHFLEPVSDLYFMEAEITDNSPSLKIPPFIKAAINVTGLPKYSNARIARGSWDRNAIS